MKELEDRIRAEGKALNEDVLRVDMFLNHQVDCRLIRVKFLIHAAEERMLHLFRISQPSPPRPHHTILKVRSDLSY